jgi:hypothetical protein
MRRDHGNVALEFAFYGSILMVMTVGLIDAGRAFFQYNAIAASARYGARWASVVGGQCIWDQSVSDWCNQLAQVATTFWLQPGNVPLQPNGSPCPATYDPANFGSSYYSVSDYSGPSNTTIVGAIANRFESNEGSPSFIQGALTPGFDASKLKVCIALPNSWAPDKSMYVVKDHDPVEVSIYYPFYPVSPLLPSGQINLVASSEYQIE